MIKYKRNYAKWKEFKQRFPSIARALDYNNVQEFSVVNEGVHVLKIQYNKDGTTTTLEFRKGRLDPLIDFNHFFTAQRKQQTMYKTVRLMYEKEFAKQSHSNNVIVERLRELTSGTMIFGFNEMHPDKISVNGVVYDSNDIGCIIWFTSKETSKYLASFVAKLPESSISSLQTYFNNQQIELENKALLNWLVTYSGFSNIEEANRAFTAATKERNKRKIEALKQQVEKLKAEISELER